ncbi:MAG: C40 family peptidase [Thermoleophilaceae bacterium]|nr:C40 family peptidase [Thermoleophilaceae bacterium]
MPSPRSNKMLLHAAVVAACLAGAVVGVPAASADDPPGAGGAVFVPPPPPPEKAQLVNGRVIAPASAPLRVKRVIAAANRLVEKPYVYGGGHKPFVKGQLDRGYDCSGAVSYALWGGRFLRSPLPSGAMMSWGQRGPGQWITVYAHGGHAYMVVAGLRFDTSLRDSDAPGPRTGPRWSRTLRESAAFVARHPVGY